MECALWMGRKKIFSADEIADSFDIAAIRGYFLGGSLEKWLMSHGGEDYAQALRDIDPADPSLNDRLTQLFTGAPKCSVPVHKADEQVIRAVEEFKGIAPPTVGSAVGAQAVSGSFGGSSFNYGSWRYSLGEYGSYSLSSFRKGSFRYDWEWEWEWYLGSFRKKYLGSAFGSFSSFSYGSFSTGSYSAFRWNLFGSSSFRYSSFNYSSVGAGSFSMGSFRYGSFPWNYDKLGSFTGIMGYLAGSFTGAGSFKALTPDEYDEIMYRTLGMCPLDCFGYGIHLI